MKSTLAALGGGEGGEDDGVDTGGAGGLDSLFGVFDDGGLVATEENFGSDTRFHDGLFFFDVGGDGAGIGKGFLGAIDASEAAVLVHMNDDATSVLFRGLGIGSHRDFDSRVDGVEHQAGADHEEEKELKDHVDHGGRVHGDVLVDGG